MILGPKITQHKYNDTHMMEAAGGRRALAKLPRREPGEREEIKRILSSHHCKRCAKCCKGAFSIGENEKNYAAVMARVKKRKKEFVVAPMGVGKFGTRYYDIGVPMARNACGFLSWEKGKIDHRTLIYSDGAKEGYGNFSCGIYDARASVCLAYPIKVEWMHLMRLDGSRDGRGTVIMDSGCPAIMDLLENGIGHISESELLSLSAEGDVDPEGLLASLPRSLQEVKDRIAEVGRSGRILLGEDGENVYPVNSWEIFIENDYRIMR